MRLLPPLLMCALLPAMAHAQTPVTAHTELRQSPGGRELASVRPGALVAASTGRDGSTLITLDGYVSASALGGTRDTFRLSVKESAGAIVRKSPDRGAPIFAVVHAGVGLQEVSRTGDWVRVRRAGWVATKALSSGGRAAAAPGGPEVITRTPAPSPVKSPQAVTATPMTGSAAPAGPPRPMADSGLTSEGDMAAARRTPVALAPGAAAIGTLGPGARVRTLARDRGWVKVRMEGWVRESDLLPADSMGGGITAADLRADPAGAKGKVVRWPVQIIAYQVADALRPDLGTDEPYLLARGPGTENALLYLALPKSLVETGRAMATPPMTKVIITARVRSGRSEPTGVPILDVLTIVKP